jgi:hypothetical protein
MVKDYPALPFVGMFTIADFEADFPLPSSAPAITS